MKWHIKILFLSIIIPMLWACDDDGDKQNNPLTVGFIKNKVDVGENTKLLSIPIQLKGRRAGSPVEVVVTMKSEGGTAKEGIDYRLLSSRVQFSNVGEATVDIEIVDNDEIISEIKTFRVYIESVIGAEKVMGEVDVFIVNDDTESEAGVNLEGSYTYKARSFYDNTILFSSKPGAVLIERDKTDPTKYYIRNFFLESPDGVLPMTMKNDLYFNVRENGIFMSAMQRIGDFGYGECAFIGITRDGLPVIDELELLLEDRGNLAFKIYGIGGFVLEDDQITDFPMYLLEQAILEKVSN